MMAYAPPPSRDWIIKEARSLLPYWRAPSIRTWEYRQTVNDPWEPTAAPLLRARVDRDIDLIQVGALRPQSQYDRVFLLIRAYLLEPRRSRLEDGRQSFDD
jgi:hypothetical protein